MTFDLCKSFVDEWILVTEEEISKAVYQFMENHHKVSEKQLSFVERKSVRVSSFEFS